MEGGEEKGREEREERRGSGAVFHLFFSFSLSLILSFFLFLTHTTFYSPQPHFCTKNYPQGPIDMPKTPEEIPSTPSAPSQRASAGATSTSRSTPEIKDVFDLLHKNYVEDDEEAFRFRYSPDFLKWALTPPGHVKEWHVGIRTDNEASRLVGFITAVPATLLVRKQRDDSAA